MKSYRLRLGWSAVWIIACAACGGGDDSEGLGASGTGAAGSGAGGTVGATGTGGAAGSGGAGSSSTAGGSSGAGVGGASNTGGARDAGLGSSGRASSGGANGGGGAGGSGSSSGTSGRAGGAGGHSAGASGSGSGAGETGAGGGSSGSGGVGAAGSAGVDGSTGACDVSDPPSNVAAWIDESWNAEGQGNITGRSAWLADSAMKGDGQINVCVRWGATSAMTASVRDQIATQMQGWFNQWFSRIHPYDCFPYESVTVKVTGYAVRPGNESLLPDGTTPIYTDQDSGSDPSGEPKCPDECGFFFHWDHSFPDCPGGADNHFDYSLWLDDSIPDGDAEAVGGDWGLRMPVSGFLSALGKNTGSVILHEMGHGFGLSDYYTWTGSKPEGGSLMIIGSTSSNVPTTADQWIARRYWKETKALRYP